jgi:hypothetical protein
LKPFVTVLPALLLAACGGGSQPRAESPAAGLAQAHVDPATAGSISGRVSFTGDAPSMPVIDMSSNPQCERQHHSPQKAETVIVNANGTLRNVFVWIKEGLAPAQWPVPAQAATLDQNGCMYVPHVQGMMENQELEIVNSDPVNHNVHAECRINAAWNESQPPRAEHKFKKFYAEEVLFPVTCSVHPWMRAYIGVSPHPFFAVTGEDGAFSLKGVPPGTYTVEAIHEKYGRKEAKLTVAPSAAASIEFSYGS